MKELHGAVEHVQVARSAFASFLSLTGTGRNRVLYEPRSLGSQVIRSAPTERGLVALHAVHDDGHGALQVTALRDPPAPGAQRHP